MALYFISLTLIILYAFFILRSIKAWKQLKSLKQSEVEELNLSVIVPCRNEKENLSSLFSDIEAQSFPKDKFEVVFVDDHSIDGTADEIAALQKEHLFRSKIIVLKEGEGKKAALTTGIKASRNNYIITTDADCQPPKNWLKTYSKYFALTKASFLAGPVHIKSGKSLFSKMQSFEFATLSGITAAFFGMKKPIMCNGANLGFSKELFGKINGYQQHSHISSGDDMFFMHEAKSLNENVQYIFEEDAMVQTHAKTSLKSFIQQRIRWAGKSTNYRDKDTIKVGFLIFMYNLLLLGLLLLFIIKPSFFHLFLLVFIAKFILDTLFMYNIRGFFHLENILLHSFILSLLYPFYTVGIGLISLLVPVKWK